MTILVGDSCFYNDDIAVFTSVLQRVGGDWVVVHGQRSSGRSPSDEPPKF